MSGMDRSLVFTALLEEPEFAAMESRRGSRLVTDAVARVELDRADPAKAGITLRQSMLDYRADVTNGGTTEPGIWERYVDALLAGDQVNAERLGVRNLPAGFQVGPMP